MIFQIVYFKACPIYDLSKFLRQPGIEPGTTAWKAAMLTITPLTLYEYLTCEVGFLKAVYYAIVIVRLKAEATFHQASKRVYCPKIKL